jgi:hypothetical protein
MRGAPIAHAMAALAVVACGRIGFDPADCTTLGPSCPTLPRFVDVQVGSRHACALTDAGELYCWGANDAGQLGLGDSIVRSEHPQRVDDGGGPWTAMSVGGEHTCGLRAGVIWCWGQNRDAQVLAMGGGTVSIPTLVPGAPPLDQIGAGGRHTCGIVAGALWCWGHNTANGAGMNLTAPTRIGALDDWTAISTGSFNSCGISASQVSSAGGSMPTGNAACHRRVWCCRRRSRSRAHGPSAPAPPERARSTLRAR